jgi:hypothetical protein
MSISTPTNITNLNEIHPRKPLDNGRSIGGEMSMMFFVRSRIVKTFATPEQYQIKSLNTQCVAGVPFPPPTWITNPEYSALQTNSENGDSNWAYFNLNLSMYNQTLAPSEWNETWFLMHGRVHPYALTWEIVPDDPETENDVMNCTIPLLTIREQGYQP